MYLFGLVWWGAVVPQEGCQGHRPAAPLPGATWGIAAPAGHRCAGQAAAGQAEPVAVAGFAGGVRLGEGGAVAEGPLPQTVRAALRPGDGPGWGAGVGAGFGPGALGRPRPLPSPDANLGRACGAVGWGDRDQAALQPCRQAGRIAVGGDQPMVRGAAAAQQQADHGDRAGHRFEPRLGPRLGRGLGGAPGGFRVPAPGGKGGRWRGWGDRQKGRGSCLVSATAVLGAGGMATALAR